MTHRVQYNPHMHVSMQYAVLVEAAHADPAETPLLKVPLAQIARRAATAGPSFRFTPTAAETQTRARGCCRVGRRPRRADQSERERPVAAQKMGGRALRRAVAAHPGRVPDAPAIVVTGAPSERPGGRRGVRGDRVAARDLAGGQDHAARAARRSTAWPTCSSPTTADRPTSRRSRRSTPWCCSVPKRRACSDRCRRSTTIIWKELACSPCVSVFNHRLSPCRNNVCMQEITVAEVYSAVETVLRSGGRALNESALRTA